MIKKLKIEISIKDLITETVNESVTKELNETIIPMLAPMARGAVRAILHGQKNPHDKCESLDAQVNGLIKRLINQTKEIEALNLETKQKLYRLDNQDRQIVEFIKELKELEKEKEKSYILSQKIEVLINFETNAMTELHQQRERIKSLIETNQELNDLIDEVTIERDELKEKGQS
jgi:hypothetical protein